MCHFSVSGAVLSSSTQINRGLPYAVFTTCAQCLSLHKRQVFNLRLVIWVTSTANNTVAGVPCLCLCTMCRSAFQKWSHVYCEVSCSFISVSGCRSLFFLSELLVSQPHVSENNDGLYSHQGKSSGQTNSHVNLCKLPPQRGAETRPRGVRRLFNKQGALNRKNQIRSPYRFKCGSFIPQKYHEFSTKTQSTVMHFSHLCVSHSVAVNVWLLH
jgi:hypothetical protein